MIRTGISIGTNSLVNEDYVEVNLSQSMNGHHNFEFRLRQNPTRGILLEKAREWIGEPATISFANHDESSINSWQGSIAFYGLVTSVVLSRRSGASELLVRGSSASIIVDGETRTRSFTDKTLQEIISDVFKPYEKLAPKGQVAIKPKVMTASLPYVVQYRESDFHFINRLAGLYGEWFYYDGINLYFGKSDEIQLVELDLDDKALHFFDISVSTAPQQVEFGGFDYLEDLRFSEQSLGKSTQSELGKLASEASKSKLFPKVPFGMITNNLTNQELKDIVRRHEEVANDELVVFNGASRNAELKVGTVIKVRDIGLKESYGEYVITRINHQIYQGGDYLNQFQAIPIEVKTPPLAMYPAAPFCETQIAKVTDVADEEKLGRVKVQFLWQDGTSEISPWIRVASPYTGKDKGFYLTPEVDDVVLVAFESNNAEKPYVLTGFYHGKTPPEWFEPKNRYKGFKSKGGNKWKFDDKNSAIQFHAPNSILMTAGKKIAFRCGKKDEDSSITMDEGKEITIKTNGDSSSIITLDAGEGTVHVIAKKITIEASETVEILSQDNVKIESLMELKMDSTEIKIEGTASIDTKAAKIGISGTATVDVKGGLIKLN